MNRHAALVLALVCTAPVAADETAWKPLTGPEIRAALEGRVLAYDAATQDFRASGKTLYTANGRDSWGNWRIEGARYCSQWPPSDLWACYGIERDGDRLRFVGEGDDIVAGSYAD